MVVSGHQVGGKETRKKKTIIAESERTQAAMQPAERAGSTTALHQH